MSDNNKENKPLVKQSENNGPPAGFNVNPQNINRNGRPKKGLTLTDIAKDILEEELPTGMTRKEALMRKIATLAYEGNETMIKMIWNYVDGLPMQKTEVSGTQSIIIVPSDIANKYGTAPIPEIDSPKQ